jgi:hypothetical protein
MTRKEREEKRQKAEKRKEARRKGRRRRRRERGAARRAERELLHAGYIGETEAVYRVLAGNIDVSDQHVPQISKSFVSDLRGVKRGKREKLRRLLAAVIARSPKIATREFWGPYYLLSILSWKAEPEDWQPRGKSAHSTFCSLVDHLVVEYPIPRFLYDVFYHHRRWTAGEGLAQFFAYLAAGGSPYRYMNSGFMPVVMTRKMCHVFLNTGNGTTFYNAVRRAQVKALGGSEPLARAICTSSLGRGLKANERFWITAIRWFCENMKGDFTQVAPLVDYIAEMHARSRDYSMKGRTLKSVMRGMEAWHRELGRVRGLRTKVYTPSGLRAGAWKFKTNGNGDKPREVTWTMTEILSTAELAAEGKAMRHCVLMYARSIVSGRTSIWSLKSDGIRNLTVRVAREEKAVVEARGKCNRRATEAEMNKVSRWAKMNGLSVRVM